MKKNIIILSTIFLIGSLYHISFFHLNEILKVADSFAYLQMSHYLTEFSQQGLGSGWFGFLYSLPIAIIDMFLGNDFLSAKIVNIILLNISAVLIWKIARKILPDSFSFLVIILWFLSPTFLHFNIHVLSENIYIPLFLGLFLNVWNLLERVTQKNIHIYKEVILIACLIGLMYLTRAEAFIYLGSIGILALGLLVTKHLSVKDFLQLGTLFFISFFIFISPYLIHLHSITGEWGLTNKGASNLRQAELRGVKRMDDAGFERAVAELTEDKTQLIAGFAGGMQYTQPQIEGSVKEFILRDPDSFINRILLNQKKLFTQNIPEIFLGKAPKLYFSDDRRFSNSIFFLFSIFPLGVLLYGIYLLYREQKIFFSVSLSFFIPALIFFTLFFTLNRYFLIFLPLLLIAFVYGLQSIWKKSYDYIKIIDIKKSSQTQDFSQKIHFHKEIYHHIHRKKRVLYRTFVAVCICNICCIYLLSTLVYYNMESPKDEHYILKKDAGDWLQENTQNSHLLKIIERFPIVTYYSGSKSRFITPYTHNIQDIYEYGIHNDLDILVVDSMDFTSYRPGLLEYIEKVPPNFSLLREFKNEKGQKVILYSLQK